MTEESFPPVVHVSVPNTPESIKKAITEASQHDYVLVNTIKEVNAEGEELANLEFKRMSKRADGTFDV